MVSFSNKVTAICFPSQNVDTIQWYILSSPSSDYEPKKENQIKYIHVVLSYTGLIYPYLQV